MIFGYNFVSISIQSTADLYTILGEMTDADKIMHLKRFGTDPIDI